MRSLRTLAAALFAIGTVTTMSACGDTSASSAPDREPGATSTTLPQHAFADAVRANDLEALTATFADDIELSSPVLAEPFVGRERVSRLFAVLIETFKDIDIAHELEDDGRYVFSFHARVGSEPIHIVDLLEFDETGRIRTFTVTARPLAGIQALAAAVSPHLARIG